MPVLLLLSAVAVVVGIAVVAAGLGDSMADAPPDRDGALLPERSLRRGDVDRLRFSLGLRGYRMDEVDDVLDRLADELDDRDRRIADLEQRLGDRPGARPSAAAASGPEPEAPDAGGRPRDEVLDDEAAGEDRPRETPARRSVSPADGGS